MKALEVKNLSKRFMLSKALDGLTVSFDKGKLVGLLGPNGSGKTTMMRIAAGLLQPSSGEIEYSNNLSKHERKELVAFMPTENHIYEWMTIKDAIDFYDEFFKDFNRAGATEIIEKMSMPLKKSVKSLSTGQRGRLKVALTLSRKADLYLLDEPLNGIDPISRDMIVELIASQINEDRCIVISSHLVHEFEQIIDEVVFIKNGKLSLQGSVDVLRLEHEMSIHDLYKEVYKDV